MGNKVNTKNPQVSNGSLAEGLYLLVNDIDIMRVLNGVQVIQNVQQMSCSARCITLQMEDDVEFPGLYRLKLIADSDRKCIYTTAECFVEQHIACLFQIYSSSVNFLTVHLTLRDQYTVLVYLTKMSPWIWLSVFICIPGQETLKNCYIVIDLVSGPQIY